MPFPIKHPAERVYAGVLWTRPLDDGETVVSATVAVSVKRGRDENPSAMVSGSATVNGDGDTVSQLIIGGIAGNVYETRWTVVTSRPRTLEERVDLIVE
jgi:hypothetical protein